MKEYIQSNLNWDRCCCCRCRYWTSRFEGERQDEGIRGVEVVEGVNREKVMEALSRVDTVRVVKRDERQEMEEGRERKGKISVNTRSKLQEVFDCPPCSS